MITPILAFEGPDGELSLDPSVESIGQIISSDEAPWESGAAMLGWIQLRDPGYSNLWTLPSLNLIVVRQIGIQLTYRPPVHEIQSGQKVLMIDSSDTAQSGYVGHSLGGEQNEFPVRSFVPIELALAVIEDFILLHTPSARANWRSQVQSGPARFDFGSS